MGKILQGDGGMVFVRVDMLKASASRLKMLQVGINAKTRQNYSETQILERVLEFASESGEKFLSFYCKEKPGA